ncbi:MAG TPA: uracil-DNA glycosylase [Pirellulales bacterium]|jgi:uracil-DNA glycosylase family 4|nr:uracil-DNA glycosylase [Pirellulales bacterium]
MLQIKSTRSANWNRLNKQIIACDRCPRLLAHCRQIAKEKRRAFADCDYWGRPVENFGDPQAHFLIVGLAPAAHGANRTGRMFTGDRSGEWLYRALYKAGFASRPASSSRDDDLRLIDCAITATCHCAPPDNKPTTEEIIACQPWLTATFDIVPARVYLALGQIAWQTIVAESRRRGWIARTGPKFGHAAIAPLGGDRWLLGSYHPSQQNTFTGKLTEAMFDAVFQHARRLLKSESVAPVL